MNANKPLTADEAALLCHEFSKLAGRVLLREPTDFFLIEHVVAAPYSSPEKETFAERFCRNANARESIAFYKGGDFDVLVFARGNAQKDVVLYESLQDYLQHEHIDLSVDDMPSYRP